MEACVHNFTGTVQTSPVFHPPQYTVIPPPDIRSTLMQYPSIDNDTAKESWVGRHMCTPQPVHPYATLLVDNNSYSDYGS